ncbi:MAG TPA: Crp/Fnr family transcriptional regulator [Chitinophagaceae bacterium]|nr:Crp/Fnr family transcriptional regulator [Chitinophagaceae bacterium]
MIDIDVLLSWGASYKKIKEEEIIFKEGTSCNFYYQLVSGRVRWVNINEAGKEFIQNIIEPGESFGELPLFDDGPYAATAIADEDSVLLRLCKPTFLHLIKENPDIHFAFTRLITERLRFKFMLLKELAFHNPEHRIFTLLNHYKKLHKLNDSRKYHVNLTRQQIADMTGLRVETVIRTIRNLHNRGELLIERGKVYC